MIKMSNETQYLRPEAEIVQIDDVDVITTSPTEDEEVPRGPWLGID